MERWRRWTEPVEIVDQPDEIIVEGDVASRSYNVKWPQEMISRIRLGYVCLKCYEPQEVAFPNECANPICAYPMGIRQTRDFELEFQGEEQFVADSERDAEDLEILAERSARRTHRTGSSISVPGAPGAKRTAGGVILPGGVGA
jgi:hypothetical protein